MEKEEEQTIKEGSLLYYSIMECNKNATFQTNNKVATRPPKLTRSPQVTFDLCYSNESPVTTQTIYTKDQNPILDIKKWRELHTTTGVFEK
tara:strand:- start:1037 stop:1309 length:273 start_codon:yes stop_codon:yes gene_type:complete